MSTSVWALCFSRARVCGCVGVCTNVRQVSGRSLGTGEDGCWSKQGKRWGVREQNLLIQSVDPYIYCLYFFHFLSFFFFIFLFFLSLWRFIRSLYHKIMCSLRKKRDKQRSTLGVTTIFAVTPVFSGLFSIMATRWSCSLFPLAFQTDRQNKTFELMDNHHWRLGV